MLNANLYESAPVEYVSIMLDLFLKSHFTEEDCDLINWYLFDRVDKVIYVNRERTLFSEPQRIEIRLNSLGDLYDYIARKNG